MNTKNILEKIFGNECKFIPRDTSKKYINNNNEDLYKIICSGYINKKDLDDISLKSFSEIVIVNK